MSGYPPPSWSSGANPIHDFVWTLSGRCGQAFCNKVEDEHPLKHSKAQPGSYCMVAHESILSRRLYGDEGEEWPTCPECGDPIEPRMVSGSGPDGPVYGQGRGRYMTERLRLKLEFIAHLKLAS